MATVTGPMTSGARTAALVSSRCAHRCAGVQPHCDAGVRESVLFIGTQFSNLYTSVDTPARGRVVVCLVFVCLVFVCKYVLGHSQVYSSDGEAPAGDGLLSHSTKKNEHEHQDIGHSTPNPGKFGAVAEGDFYQPETPTAHQVVNGQRLARS